MKSNVGLWIDHRKAVIVSITEKSEKIRRIVSHMEKHVRFSGEPREISAEEILQRKKY